MSEYLILFFFFFSGPETPEIRSVSNFKFFFLAGRGSGRVRPGHGRVYSAPKYLYSTTVKVRAGPAGTRSRNFLQRLLQFFSRSAISRAYAKRFNPFLFHSFSQKNPSEIVNRYQLAETFVTSF